MNLDFSKLVIEFKDLTDRQYFVIYSKYWTLLTNKEIGVLIHKSKWQVHQIISKSLRKLRKNISILGDNNE